MTQTFDNATTRTANIDGIPFVYRRIGSDTGTPLVMLHHLTAVIEDWDPRTIDGLAQERSVIVFDNRGVGASGGLTPESVEEMAQDAVLFIKALGLTRVDLFGYSLNGCIAQVIALSHPHLVRRIVLAGTSGPGGGGFSEMGAVLEAALATGAAENRRPKELLFFPPSEDGRRASSQFLERLKSRQIDRDEPVRDQTVVAQTKAIASWGMMPKPFSNDAIFPASVHYNGRW